VNVTLKRSSKIQYGTLNFRPRTRSLILVPINGLHMISYY